MLSHKLAICIATFSAALLLAGCEPQQPVLKVSSSEKASSADLAKQVDSDSYRFGFDLRSSPQEDSRQYQPLLDYLEKKTGLKFSLVFVRSDKPVAEQIAAGTIDFAAAGAVTAIRTMRNGSADPLVLGVSSTGATMYRSAIVVPTKSQSRNLGDLKGSRLALGAESSTQGNLIPRLMLMDARMTLADFAAVTYTGSHKNCADAVIEGKADACGMQDSMAERLATENKLKILQFSAEYPSSGVIAATHVPAEIRNKVKQALLEFEPEGRDSQALYHWDRTEMPKGFRAARREDYAPLEAGMSSLNF